MKKGKAVKGISYIGYGGRYGANICFSGEKTNRAFLKPIVLEFYSGFIPDLNKPMNYPAIRLYLFRYLHHHLNAHGQ